MTAISKQFHALPSEFPELLKGLLADESIFKIKGVAAPSEGARFAIRYSLLSDLDFNGPDSIDHLAFTMEPPDLGVERRHQFMDRHPDALIVDIGKLTDSKLYESGFSARTSNPMALKRWQKAARQLCKLSKTGCRAVNPANGDSGPAWWHRCTAGAEIVFHRGIILQALGACIITPPERPGEAVVC